MKNYIPFIFDVVCDFNIAVLFLFRLSNFVKLYKRN